MENIKIEQIVALLNMVISLVQLIISLFVAFFAFKTLNNGQETIKRQKSKDYEEEKRRNDYEEKKQAININSWIEESDQSSDSKELKVFAVLQNNSNQCAYNVCFMLRNRDEVVKPIKKQKCKEFNKVFKGIIGEPTKIRYLPPHKTIRIELKKDTLFVPEVLFTDSNNIEWFRDFRGNLIKYNYMSLDYFHLFTAFRFYLPQKNSLYK